MLVRRDCAQWASSVDEQIPSIVVDARDGAGRDIGDVSVSIDGEIVARSLDGKGIPVDPGPHILVFARAGAPSVTEKVIIKEGARGRTFVIRFGGAAATAPTAPQREDAPNSSGAARVHTWPPWVLIGVGAVFVGTGVVVIAAAPAAPQGCSSSLELCARVPDETAAAFSERQREASRAKNQPIYGGIVVGAGVLILGGGLLWHFLEPTGPEPARSARSARLVPWSTSDAAGVAAVGTF